MRRFACAAVAMFLLSVRVALCRADDDLAGFWRFDAAAESVADLSGHGLAAQVAGGRVIVEDGKNVLALDGQQKIVVPSSQAWNLRAGFSIVMKIRISDMVPGRTLMFKKGQYALRINSPGEGGCISFFPCVTEPRVTCAPLPPDAWYHVVATWDGRQSVLWVNGIPFVTERSDQPPAPSDAPLVIASTSEHGGGIRGALEYVKIYHRALLPKEVITETYGVAQGNDSQGNTARTAEAQSATADFDFTQGAASDHWTAQAGAAAALAENRLVVNTKSPWGLIINNRLNANIDTRDWIILRMSIDKGSQAKLVFVTTQGAGHIPLQINADGKPHTYAVEAWTQVGWSGELLALGLMPSNRGESTAKIERLQVTQEPAAAEVKVNRIFSDSTFPRAERPDRIVARLRSMAGTAKNLTATLSAPEGVRLKSPASQTVAAIEHHDELEIAWEVEAERPLSGPFQVSVSGSDLSEPSSAVQSLTFHANPRLDKGAYVPVPVPAKTKYNLWTHYCALWKTGTHWGWSKIEPWPERKPVLGWYNDGSPEVADWHIKFMVEHGISGVIYCWYRTNVNAPVQQSLGHAIHDGLMKARYLSMIKFGIMWENGCGSGVGSADDLLRNVLPFWIDNYFSHPSYARVDGKPVLYVWVPPNLRKQLGGSENVRKAFDQMRAECTRRGLGGLYIVGSVQRGDKAALEALAAEGWDASSAYCNNWTVPANMAYVGDYTCSPYEGFVDQQEGIWRFKRDLGLQPDITTMMMGWDARPWHKNGFFWSENTPEKFRDLCQRAKSVIDAVPDGNPVKNRGIFCCWNEFGEGHYIEPTRGKGFSYLDVIREVFCDGPQEHIDLAPEDVRLSSPDSWYAAVREPLYLGHPKSARETRWSGDTLASWKAIMGLKDTAVRDGVLSATSTSRDPALASPSLELHANRFSKVIVEMRISRPAGAAQLFWTTQSKPRAGEATSAAAATIADGQWHECVFNVSKNANWDGCVTSLRLDPAQKQDVAIEIKSIRLE